MNRKRLLAAALVTAIGLLGQAGMATAEDGEGSPTAVLQPGGTDSSGETDGATSTTTGTTETTTPIPNIPPVARADTKTVTAGRSVVVYLLANDSDEDAGPSPLEISSVPSLNGRIERRPQSIVFTARLADRGKFTFNYTVTDGLNTDTAPVTVTVLPRRVTITTARTVVALRNYRIHGYVAPPLPGPVTVVVQRLAGDRWVRHRADRASAKGAYSVPFSTNRAKRFVFRAVATWGDDKRAISARLSRTVVARPDASVSGPLTRSQVPYSWRSGCPVPPSGLRAITINRFNYDRVVARGRLVVKAGAVSDILTVFRASLSNRFPVRSMRTADAFYAGGRHTPTESDLAAMRADNTSAFNCRPVTGNPYRVSQHSYGNAIDINTVRNPYVVGSRVYPSFARTYLDRSNYRKGMILSRGVIASKMRQVGWPWGARWSSPDYQHFSANGG